MEQQLVGRKTGPYDAALFDLDGVLMDSRPVMREALSAAWAALRQPGVPEFARFEQALGRPLPQIFSILGWPSELAPLYAAESCRRVRAVRVYEGIREALQLVRSSGIKLAVVTGKEHVRAAQLLRAHGMLDMFSALIGGDDCARGKPAPDPILAAITALALPAARTLMIGDSPLDMQAATAAGVLPVGALWGYSSDTDLISGGSRLLLDGPAGIADALLTARQVETP